VNHDQILAEVRQLRGWCQWVSYTALVGGEERNQSRDLSMYVIIQIRGVKQQGMHLMC